MNTRKASTVAHLCLTKGWGGLELYSLLLHERSVKDGIPTLHFCIEGSPLQKRLKELGLQYEAIPYGKYLNLKASRLLRTSIKKYQVDKILVHSLRNLYLLYPATIGLEKPTVIGFAQIFSQIKKKGLIHKLIYGQMKKLIVLTDIQRQASINNLPLLPEQVVTIPNGVDCNRFSPSKRSEALRQELGVLPTDILIGVVGRLDPAKGQFELVQAFSSIYQSNPNKYDNLKLLIIGDETLGSHGYKEKLETFIKENKINNRVIFMPFKSDISPHMASIDIFTMPSYEEAFGIVLVEAMASGAPVISTHAGGVPDILNSDNLGLMVKPRDVEDLKRGLQLYLDNFTKLKEQAISNLPIVRKRFHFDSTYDRIMSL